MNGHSMLDRFASTAIPISALLRGDNVDGMTTADEAPSELIRASATRHFRSAEMLMYVDDSQMASS
jgi:hypothetical protein